MTRKLAKKAADDLVIDLRRQKVEAFYLQSWPQYKIAEELGVVRQTHANYLGYFCSDSCPRWFWRY